MSQPGSPKKRPRDAEGVESSPGTDQGNTPEKGWKKSKGKEANTGDKVTVDIQQWPRKENGKAVKIKLTDLRIDERKERGQSEPSNEMTLSKRGLDTKRCRHRDRCA